MSAIVYAKVFQAALGPMAPPGATLLAAPRNKSPRTSILKTTTASSAQF